MANLHYLLYEAALAVVAIMLLDWFRHSWRGWSYYGLAFVAVVVLQTAFVFVQMMKLKKRTEITEDREPLHETYRLTKQIVCRTIVYMPRLIKHDRTSLIGPEGPSWIGSERHALGRLVDWLNLKNSDPGDLAFEEKGRTRVREIIGLLQQLYSLDAQGHAGKRLPASTELQSELNRRLHSSHKGVRQVFDFGNGLCSRWLPAYVNQRNFSRKRAAVFEFLVTDIVMDLADSKLLSRVRLCGCGKYFVARSSLTRFCSATCRIEFWESSEERKRQKREKAREYYILRKTGIVRRNKLGRTGRSK